MTERHRRGSSSVSVVLEIEDEDCLDESSKPTEESIRQDKLYPLALLKIAMAMKKLNDSQSVHFEEIMDQVLSGMVIDREDFSGYVRRNMNRLVLEVQERNY